MQSTAGHRSHSGAEDAKGADMKTPAPMLASVAATLPDLKGWTIEPKWDGIRVIADVSATRVSLWSRNGIDKAGGFPELVAALSAIAKRSGPVVLDGELVAIDASGAPLRFQAFQRRNTTSGARTSLVVFDCLMAAGHSWTSQPWTERRQGLELIIARSKRALVRRGESAPCGSREAARLIQAAQDEGWEGLILKRMDSRYESGKRSPSWKKVKLEHEQEFVIGGYTPPTEGVIREFGALLVGHYDKARKLRYAGKIGTGYTQQTLASLGAKLKKLKRTTSPFAGHAGKSLARAIWVEPKLVAQVKYNEMTNLGLLRQPVFLGLRDDKNPKDVRLEADTSAAAILEALRCGTAD